MAQATFDNFGDLYRAAFAEQDADRKLFLLSEVRRAIERWEKEMGQATLAEKPKPPAMVAPFPPVHTFNSKQIA